MALIFYKEKNGTELEIKLAGRLDTESAPDFEEYLKESLDNVTVLTLNCEKLEYISSAGLRVILLAQKIMTEQGSMKLIHVNKMLLEIFEATGLAGVLKIR